MCSMNAYIILTISLCSTLPISAFGADLVPIYIWESSSDGQPTVYSTSALAKKSKNELKAILQERFQRNPIVLLFAEENLSVEDFCWRDEIDVSVYSQLKNLTSSSDVSSVYLPFADGPLEVLLRSFPTNGQRWSKANVGPAGVPTLNVNVPNSNFLLVSLEDATDSDDRPSLLRRHDAFITEIYKSVLEKHKHVIGIYTARHSSWHSGSRRVRQVQSEDEGDGPENEEEKSGKASAVEGDLEGESEKTPAENDKESTTSTSASSTPPVSTTSEPELEATEPSGFYDDEYNKIDFNKETYMTIPILSGLTITVLMLIILFVGVNALSEIKTNSRFDDPKGKGLVVPAE